MSRCCNQYNKNGIYMVASEPVLTYSQIDPDKQCNFIWNFKVFTQKDAFENVIDKNVANFI